MTEPQRYSSEFLRFMWILIVAGIVVVGSFWNVYSLEVQAHDRNQAILDRMALSMTKLNCGRDANKWPPKVAWDDLLVAEQNHDYLLLGREIGLLVLAFTGFWLLWRRVT